MACNEFQNTRWLSGSALNEAQKRNGCKSNCQGAFSGNVILSDGCKCWCHAEPNRFHLSDIKGDYLKYAFENNIPAQQEFFSRFGYDPFITDNYNPCLNNAMLVNGEYICVVNENDTTPTTVETEGKKATSKPIIEGIEDKNLFMLIGLAILLILILA